MRPQILCALSLVAGFGVSPLSAQTTPPGDADLKRDVAALRDAVIQQTRQIDALTTEIERLGVAMGQRRPSKPAATPEPALGATPVVAPTAPAATILPAATPAPTPLDPNVVQHTVIKGENLTIISKKYGVPIEAIQKRNKITDVRKMQVGQVLEIPLPSPSPVPTAAVSPVSPAPSPSPAH